MSRPTAPSRLHPPFWGPLRWRRIIGTVDPTFVVISLVALILYLIAGARASVHDITDSLLYRQIAGQPFGWDVLIHNKRPLLYPLLIRLCGSHGRFIVALQAAAYVGAWGLLAWTIFRPLRDAGRIVHGAILAILTYWIGLWPIFAGWNHLIMTESLSNAGLVAIMALLVSCVIEARDRDLYGAVGVACAVALIRDASAYFCVLMIGLVGVLAVSRRVTWRAATFSTLALVASYALMVWSAGHVLNDPMDGRWVFPMLNDFGLRVLPDPEVTRWFTDHGMPMNQTLRTMTGKLSYQGAYDWQFYRDPRLAAFRHWLLTDGKGLYQRYILTQPGWTLHGVWRDRAELMQPFGFSIQYYYDPRFRLHLVPVPDPIWVYGFVLVTAPLALLIGAIRRERIAIAGGLLCCALVAMVGPLAVIIDRADTMELGRHAIALPLQLSLAAIGTLFFLVCGRDLVRPSQLRAMPR